MTRAGTYPVYEALIPKRLFEVGLGNVLISRRMGNTVAAGVFLVDLFCLGVKNATSIICSSQEYQAKFADFRIHEELIPIQPACARKLIEGAIVYAQDLGFSPHEDYLVAKTILGDIDPNACSSSFHFGKDGKPYFFAGPNETPLRCQEIINTLTKRCGPDGFHYLIGMDADQFEAERE